MPSQLSIAVGQYSDKGRKALNQDFHGVYTPTEPLLSAKGVAIALADGISSSDVSHIASETAIAGFFNDYYCTSEAWTVKKSAQRVLMATNSWLHSQTQRSQYRYDKDRGYVCTLSALVIKSTTAHIFHVGDARIYRCHDTALEQLTEDHRVWVSRDQSHLSRALGINAQLEIDYRALQVAVGDLFLLATDGVYEFVTADRVTAILAEHKDDLEAAAKALVDAAYERGSDDNLTAQFIRIDDLPSQEAHEIHQQMADLALPPMLEPRMTFDGYEIVRELHLTNRSRVHLATDLDTQRSVVIKTPGTDFHQDAAYLERFLTEEWIARRIDSPHVLQACELTRRRHYLYTVSEYIEGQTLTQWMRDNPKPDLETVRDIVEQIAKGLRAFHRLEMLHQDLRPDNVMIDRTDTVKIIDFGSTSVAGLREIRPPLDQDNILGTAQYTAPEYFVSGPATIRSDLFSLGVITYQMLTGELPYGTQVAKAKSATAQKKLKYLPVRRDERELPPWLDDVLMTALNPDPDRRYAALSEFTYELRHANPAFLNKTRPPLLERNPVLVWQGISLVLAIIIGVLLMS